MVMIWINKQTKDDLPEQDAIIFNLLNKNNKSNVKTNVQDLWRIFGNKSLKPINEDLLILAISIFCADKRIPRTYFADSWTRYIEINIPVIEYEKWLVVKDDLESMFNFLSGDKWTIKFRRSNDKFRGSKERKYKLIKDKQFDGVSLFSGGLDSFCGAIKLLSEGKKICFVGFREYGLISSRQYELYNAINNYYKNIYKEILLFSVTPFKPHNLPSVIEEYGVESSSRSRSFLFLAGALSAASIIGDKTPVYIPENGFIGINVPLTDSRHGSCSTRTTHPYFIGLLNKILNDIDIKNEVVNFYSTMTKGEIVSEFSNTPIFKNYANKTISCSHPCQSRYDGIKPPLNCGYCYPCIIRKASMNKIDYKEDAFYNPNYKLTKNFIETHNNINGKASDFRAVLLSLKNYMDNENNENYFDHILLKNGKLSIDELENYKRVYIESMKEIFNFVRSEDQMLDSEILEYLCINKNEEGSKE